MQYSVYNIFIKGNQKNKWIKTNKKIAYHIVLYIYSVIFIKEIATYQYLVFNWVVNFSVFTQWEMPKN